MRLHRFFVKNKINIDEKVVLRFFDYDSILSQWKKVFRYLAGSRVVLFDGSGSDYLCIIEKFDNNGAVLRVLESYKTKNEEIEKNKKAKKTGKNNAENRTSTSASTKDRRVTLIMSLIKNDNFDLVLQKATELGVNQIVPIITERTIKKDLNMTRSQRILVEASEQCGRSDVPIIVPPRKLADVLKDLPMNRQAGQQTGKQIGIFVCNQNGLKIKDILAKSGGSGDGGGKNKKLTDLIFIIGPEGGWSPKEIKLFDELKIQAVSIHQNVLRAETAAIALLGQLFVV